MRKTIISVLLFLPLVAMAQLNQSNEQGEKQGYWKQTYANGVVLYEGEFDNGMPVGVFKRYYEDGSLQAEMNYKNEHESFAQLYYPEIDVMMAEGKYIDQKRDSIWLFYTEQGVLSSRETYAKGMRNGTTEIYFSDGSVSERSIFKDNEKNGLWEQFFENGNPKLKAYVKEGIMYDGEYVTYYPDGMKLEQGKYVDGKKESSWYLFNEDGSIHIIYVYREDQVVEEHPKNGTFELYWDNDIQRSEYTYQNGLKEGRFKEWYDQGEWRNEERIDEFGNKLPIQKLYGTQLSREGSYKAGKLHGEIINYSQDGKVTKKESYNMGELIK